MNPLQSVLLVDRVLRHRGSLTEQAEDDGLGLRRLSGVSLLVGRGLVGGERNLAHRPAADGTQRFCEQSVRGRRHEQTQVIDGRKILERIAGLRIEVHDDLVDHAVQVVDLVSTTLTQKRCHGLIGGRGPGRNGQVEPLSEGLANEVCQLLLGAADLDHGDVGSHHRHQHLVPDM